VTINNHDYDDCRKQTTAQSNCGWHFFQQLPTASKKNHMVALILLLATTTSIIHAGSSNNKGVALVLSSVTHKTPFHQEARVTILPIIYTIHQKSHSNNALVPIVIDISCFSSCRKQRRTTSCFPLKNQILNSRKTLRAPACRLLLLLVLLLLGSIIQRRMTPPAKLLNPESPIKNQMGMPNLFCCPSCSSFSPKKDLLVLLGLLLVLPNY
jgi:hypothetical protein